MKKRLFAFLLLVTVLLSSTPALALEGDTARCADTLATLGLIQGDDGGERLTAPATRAHAAVLLVRLAGAEAAAKDTRPAGFRDVPGWVADAVNYAALHSWVNGRTETTFCPDETITANAWFTMLLRMLGYWDADCDFDVEDAAQFARRIGLCSRSYTGLMTRGDLFESIVDALAFRYRGTERTVLQTLLERSVVPVYAVRALGLDSETLTARQIADRYMAAVFCMDSYETAADAEAREGAAHSSGFFISPDGLAVTNYHAIKDKTLSTVTLCTGEQYPVERVIYYDTGIDIAVLQISKTAVNGSTTSAFACLEIVGTADIRPGDTVYSLGNPLGLGLAISSGIISDPARGVKRYELPCVMNTADISQGSSGGALLNEYGRVIAVTSGAYTYGNNMYLAVPADPVLTADLTVPGWTLEEVAQREADD